MSRRKPKSVGDAFSDLRSDYSIGQPSRFRRKRPGLPSMGAHADYHFRNESHWLKSIETARDMDRNDSIVPPLVNMATANTLGAAGITLDARTGDAGLDKAWEENWFSWGEDPEMCDVAGEMTWADFEEFAVRQTHVDGDIVFLGVEGGSLEAIEAHRIRTPMEQKSGVVQGVEMNSVRRRLRYWITKEDLSPSSPLTSLSEVRQVEVRDDEGQRQLFHMHLARRVTQTRGVSSFMPIIDLAGMIDDINFAKVVQQQIVSCFAIIHTYDVMGNTGPSPVLGAGETQTLPDGTSRQLDNIAPGMKIHATVPGEKIQGFSPSVPNPEFFEHIRFLLTLVGINLGLPLVVYLLDASETNYSGFRGAVDQARLQFRRNQSKLIRRMHEPIYRWKVRQWLADDPAAQRIARKRKVNPFGAVWHAPFMPQIDPLKDTNAESLQVRTCLNSLTSIENAKGRDSTEIFDEIAEERTYAIKLAKARAKEINDDDDTDPVSWRDVMPLPSPEGISGKIESRTDAGAAPGPGGAPSPKSREDDE